MNAPNSNVLQLCIKRPSYNGHQHPFLTKAKSMQMVRKFLNHNIKPCNTSDKGCLCVPILQFFNIVQKGGGGGGANPCSKNVLFVFGKGFLAYRKQVVTFHGLGPLFIMDVAKQEIGVRHVFKT